MTEPTVTTQAAPEAAPAEAPVIANASNSLPSQRDELIAAANAVVTQDDAPPAPEAKPAEKAVPEPVVAEDPAVSEPVAAEATEGVPYLARLIREKKEKEKLRLEKQKLREEVQSTYGNEKTELEKARAEVAAERAAVEAKRKELAQYERFAKMTPEDQAEYLMNQGSPQHKAISRLEQQLDELRQERAAEKADNELRVRRAEEYRQQQAVSNQRKAEETFVKYTADQSKYPTLAKLDDDMRLSLGYSAANKIASVTKQVASDEQIAEYLERSLSGKASGTEHPATVQGRVQQGRTGSRTLSNAVASERRSSPKPTNNDLSGEELRKELYAAAKDALTSA